MNKSNQNSTNPYDFNKSEYNKAYEACANSGTGLPIVNKLLIRFLCYTGIATKEYDNNRKI